MLNPFEAENMFMVAPYTQDNSKTPSPTCKEIPVSRSPNFQPDQRVETPRIIRYDRVVVTKFASMPPEVLSCIAEMMGERLPTFMFANRVLFKQTLQGQLHLYEM